MSAGPLEKVDDVGDVGWGEASRRIADGVLTTPFQKNACPVVTAGLHGGQGGFRAIGIVQAGGECGVGEDGVSLRIEQRRQADVVVSSRCNRRSAAAIEEFRQGGTGPRPNPVRGENGSRGGARS